MGQLRIGIASPWANLGSVSIRSWPRQLGSMLQVPARTARQTAVARVMYVRRILAATPASGRDTADPAVYRSGVRGGGGAEHHRFGGDPVPGLGGRGSGPVRGRLGSREPLSLSLCLSPSLSLPLSRALSLSLSLSLPPSRSRTVPHVSKTVQPRKNGSNGCAYGRKSCRTLLRPSKNAVSALWGPGENPRRSVGVGHKRPP